MTWLGIDTGGTFTDFVLWRDGHLRVHKVLSTPAAPEQAILTGMAQLGLEPCEFKLVHGSTVATNAVLEGKGARTVLVTNRGFADLLTIGRQNRAAMYDLQPTKPAPPVPPELCLETGGRITADGSELEPLTEPDLDDLAQAVASLQPEAVAVNLLFSYLDDSHEQRIAAALPQSLFLSLSSQVLPEIREVERGMATWLNAFVGPKVRNYLSRLSDDLPDTSISVMQSSGETIAADLAANQAVRMLLSGPAGGLAAAQLLGEQTGQPRLLSFDMGGTSTDVALLDGAPKLTNEGHIGPYPVAVPMVDMHTIGAGGGSLAWLDEGGMLQVGPKSAGADPGPACYGRGGRRPTVTDANLLLGRLGPDARLAGDMPLHAAAARAAFKPLAEAMGCDIEQAAAGVIDIANEHMAAALRSISVARGIDPRGFVLLPFGGAGGLHVCDLAERLDLEQALIPSFGGVLSALGMLAARPGRRLTHTLPGLLDELDNDTIETGLAELAEQGRAELTAEGIASSEITVERALDLRYAGQSYTLTIPWQDTDSCSQTFHAAHQESYGHRLELPVELVNLRVAVLGPNSPVRIPERTEIISDQASLSTTAADGEGHGVWRRDDLRVGQRLRGPAVITESVSTTWLAPGWSARVDQLGNLLLARENAA